MASLLCASAHVSLDVPTWQMICRRFRKRAGVACLYLAAGIVKRSSEKSLPDCAEREQLRDMSVIGVDD